MDDMFFRSDGKSLKRGKRRDRRTPTCRPCLVWSKERPDDVMEGVVMDANRYGLCIRTLTGIDVGVDIFVQLMRDENFRDPIAAPMVARVARQVPDGSGFIDHGIEIYREDIRREESRPIVIPKRRPGPVRARPRMHTLDITVGDYRSERSRR